MGSIQPSAPPELTIDKICVPACQPKFLFPPSQLQATVLDVFLPGDTQLRSPRGIGDGFMLASEAISALQMAELSRAAPAPHSRSGLPKERHLQCQHLARRHFQLGHEGEEGDDHDVPHLRRIE